MEDAVEITVGERLRKARKERSLSIEDVAAEIMVPQHYLKSIEEDRFEALPGQTYAIGFVRNYSRYLNLPASDLVAALKEQVDFPKPLDSYEIASGFVPPPRASMLPSYGSVFAGLSIVAVVYALWTVSAEDESTAALPAAVPGVQFEPMKGEQAPQQSLQVAQVYTAAATIESKRYAVAQDDEAARPTDIPKVMDVKPAAPRAPEPEIAADVEAEAPDLEDVAIHVGEESWIEVRTDERVVFSGIKQAGDKITVSGLEALSSRLTTGNAGGIWLSVGDWTSAALGASGRVRRNLDLAPEQLVAELAPADRS
ncbi:MAG: RodZ domain-containing protein [Pseudomonadota bacterium]